MEVYPMSNKHKTIVQAVLDQADHEVDDREIAEVMSEELPLFMYAFRNSPEEIIYVGFDTDACRDACLADLKRSGFVGRAVKERMHFTGRSERAIRRWLYGEAIPQRADWLMWQYWLRAKGFYTQELDNMPNVFFRLRKHILSKDISFRAAARRLGWTQEWLWGVLNNEIKDHEALIHSVGKIHVLCDDINLEITQRDIQDVMEIVLDPDGELSEVKQRYGLVSESEVDKQKRRKRTAKQLRGHRFWSHQPLLPVKQQAAVDLLMGVVEDEDYPKSLKKVRVLNLKRKVFKAAKKAGISNTTCRRAISELMRRGVVKTIEKGSAELVVCKVKFRDTSQS